MRCKTRTLAAVGAALLTLVAAGCGGHDHGSGSPEAAAGDLASDEGQHDHGESSAVAAGARELEVRADELAFQPDELTVEAGSDVAVVLTSVDQLHDFTIDELDAHVSAAGGKTAKGGFTASIPGRFTYYCSVPGHREAGMEGELVVTGDAEDGAGSMSDDGG